jgi:signal transduction histidine kinase
MTLRRRLVLTSLAVALPVSSLLFAAVESQRKSDITSAVGRIVNSQVNETFRARCEADPAAITGGDLRPRVDPSSPDDVPPPRGKIENRPFELFVYDESFVPQHPIGPHFPDDFRKLLRSSAQSVTGPFVSSDGTGVQAAVLTGWVGGPCRVLLARLRPGPHDTRDAVLLFFELFVAAFAVGLLVSGETLWRIQRTTQSARKLAASEYREIVPVRGRDEIGSLAFALNEASADIRRRAAEARDREGAFARFVASTTEDTRRPFEALQDHLGHLEREGGLTGAPREHVRAASGEAHDLVSLLQNLSAAAKLRTREEPGTRQPVDLKALVARVISHNDFVARAAAVGLAATVPNAPVVITGDTLLIEQAVGNLVDNAIRYNKPGGHVTVTLDRKDSHDFSLRVLDDGPGVSDEELKQMTNVRRFRGDEAKVRRPHSIGLGLAVVREAADRFGIQWAFRRPRGGGFEAELSGNTSLSKTT